MCVRRGVCVIRVLEDFREGKNSVPGTPVGHPLTVGVVRKAAGIVSNVTCTVALGPTL